MNTQRIEAVLRVACKDWENPLPGSASDFATSLNKLHDVAYEESGTKNIITSMARRTLIINKTIVISA